MLSTTRGRQTDGGVDRAAMVDWNASSYNLHLDLYNFQDEAAVDSPYILTSPRSLEACTDLDIKPVELLHKDLTQFEEDCLLTGQPLSNATVLYQEHEQRRLIKLRECRRLRERLVLQQDNKETLQETIPSNAARSFQESRSSQTDQGDVKIKKDEFGQGDNRNSYKTSPRQMKMESSKSTTIPSSWYSTTSPNITTSGCWHMTDQPSHSTGVNARSKVRGRRPASVCSSGRSSSRLSMSSLTSALSDQDQKILTLLEKKYRDQQFLDEMQQEMRLAWDEQRQTEQRSKVSDEIQRRRNLVEKNSLRRKKKEKLQRQKQTEKEQELRESEMNLQYKDLHQKRILKEQEALTQHQIHLKKLSDLEKKKKQEIARKKIESEEAGYQQAVYDYRTHTLEKAELLRRDRERQEKMELKKRNAKDKLRYMTMKASVDKDKEDYTSTLVESILLKQSRAERALSNQHWTQQHEINLHRQKEDALQEKSRQSRQEMEEENRQWQRHLMHQSLMSQEKAAQLANDTIQSKAIKVKQVRHSKEFTQKQLKKRVEEDDALFQESVKLNLAYKDMKSQALASQKQEVIQRSRVVAMETAKLRDQIREQYQGSFDKMVERANHRSRFGRGPQMSTKNYGSFALT